MAIEEKPLHSVLCKMLVKTMPPNRADEVSCLCYALLDGKIPDKGLDECLQAAIVGLSVWMDEDEEVCDLLSRLIAKCYSQAQEAGLGLSIMMSPKSRSGEVSD